MRPPCRPAERSPSTVGRGALPQAPVEWGRRREAPTPGRLTRRAARAFPPPPPCSYGCVGSGLAGGGGRCGRPGLGGAVEGRWRGAHGEGDGGGRERPAPRRSALYSGGGGGGVRALGGRRYVAVRVGMWVVTWLSLFFIAPASRASQRQRSGCQKGARRGWEAAARPPVPQPRVGRPRSRRAGGPAPRPSRRWSPPRRAWTQREERRPCDKGARWRAGAAPPRHAPPRLPTLGHRRRKRRLWGRRSARRVCAATRLARQRVRRRRHRHHRPCVDEDAPRAVGFPRAPVVRHPPSYARHSHARAAAAASQRSASGYP